jgi:hypothetical protein
VTDLGWLVAVLRPDLLTTKSVTTPEPFDTPRQLAALLRGRLFSPDDEPFGPFLEQVRQTLSRDTIRVGVAGIKDLLTGPEPPQDLAQSAAAALLASAAAAELDDYATIDEVIDSQLKRASESPSTERIIRASLLSQRALRYRDAGLDYGPTVNNVVRLLALASPDDETKRQRDAESETYAAAISAAVFDAATSHLGPARPSAKIDPDLEEFTRSGGPFGSRNATLYEVQSSYTYGRFLERLFNERFRTNTWSLGGTSRADLFYDALPLELAGHAKVYEARKDLAILRLVQAAASAPDDDVDDCLRLLRQSGARAQLELALRWARASGPLDAIGRDARQVILRRLPHRMLRVPELIVLRDAAELLTSAEALVASDAVFRSLELGPPPDGPIGWQAPELRMEAAWVCLAALSVQAGNPEQVSNLLFERVQRPEANELEDTAIAKAMNRLPWDDLGSTNRQTWIEWSLSHEASSSVAETVIRRARIPQAITAVPADLASVARALNSQFRGGAVSERSWEAASEVVADDLSRIRRDASRHAFSMGAHSSADIAAALILHASRSELWSPLVEFLVDPVVARDDRTSAFDRLSTWDGDIPDGVRNRVREVQDALLTVSGPSFFDEAPITPYPAALRFLAMHDFLTDADFLSLVSELVGSPDAQSRREGARTLEQMAASGIQEWMLALALQLSHDTDAEVQGSAARTLASLATSAMESMGAASARLVELLDFDGYTVPLGTIRALSRFGVPLDSRIRASLGHLAESHPSALVRQEAKLVISRSENSVVPDS